MLGWMAGGAVSGGEDSGGAWGPPALLSHCIQGLALTHVLEQNLKPIAGPRPEAATVVILVTDGKSQDDARTAGHVLKELGVDVFAVGEQPPGSPWSSCSGVGPWLQVGVCTPASPGLEVSWPL